MTDIIIVVWFGILATIMIVSCVLDEKTRLALSKRTMTDELFMSQEISDTNII